MVVGLSAYPTWWLYPLFSHRPPKRLGTRFSDTIQIEINSDGLRRGWSTFLHYGSDFYPNGKNFFSLEWMSQFLLHVYTWISSLFLVPADVLHSWILIGWIASGIAVYWSVRMFGASVAAALIAGILVQMMPAFRWFAINHVNYMPIAVAALPAAFVLRATVKVDHQPLIQPIMYAGVAHLLLLFLDGYIGYFAVLLTIFAIGISATLSGRSRKLRVGGLAISGMLLICLFLAGRIFAVVNRDNAARTLRTYIGGVDSNIQTLVTPKPDPGFGNLSPFVGWAIIGLVVLSLIIGCKFRSLLMIGYLLGISTAFSFSVRTWSWSFPLDVLGNFVPRMRFYDRYAVLMSIILIATSVGVVLGGVQRTIFRSVVSVIGLFLVSLSVLEYHPRSLRGVVDSSLSTESITAALLPGRDVVLRIGEPPLFAGVRFASFPSQWDERYALSRGNEYLRDVACASGATHILVNGTKDGAWQSVQYMSAYGPREWVNFDDRRYFTAQASGWWDDRSDATTFDRIPLRLLQLRNCRNPGTPINALAGPIEVVNDGVIIRQIRQDSFNNVNFAISPRVLVEPRFGGDHRDSVLSWRFTVGMSDGFTLPHLNVLTSHSGSSVAKSFVLQTGQSRLVLIHTRFPHKVTIETQPRSREDSYFSISNFEVRSLGKAP